MGKITALFARKVIDAAGDDVNRAALLARVGLSPDGAPDVRSMIADADYYSLLEMIAAQLDDARGFPLRVGQSMRCDDYGAFGLAWKTAPTLRGSLARAERYGRLLTSVTKHEVRDHPRGAYFLLQREGARRLGLRLSNEATLASVVSIMRQVSPVPISPLEVHLKHPAPSSVATHAAYFGCPVIFDSSVDGILVSDEDLERGNRLGDPAISQFLIPHLDQEMSAIAQESSFEQVLLRLISDHLSEGPPRVADMAQKIGVGERTLHRRLSEQHTTFQGILEKARRRLAEGLLARTDHSIAEIAFLTGFSEQSSFTRAFKRWVGQTPAAYRADHAAR
ncbi:MAG TPA: AraC family transcriptional regulator [Roseovarius sp.]